MRQFWGWLLTFGLLGLGWIQPAYAYFGGLRPVEPDLNSGGVVVIGQWYQADPEDTQPPKIVTFDPDKPPTFPLKKGDIVLVKNENGETTGVYIVLRDVAPNQPGFDPTKPNNDWARPMSYAEDTRDYRWYHHYMRGDYVLYEGKLYQWSGVVNHNPNTVSQVWPGESNYWQPASLPTGVSDVKDLWYRHKIYLAGERVWYQGDWYEAILSGRSGYEPSQTKAGVWKPLDQEVPRQRPRAASLPEREVTASYRWFHNYETGDYVIFKGELYQWQTQEPHKPLSSTAEKPGEGERWQVVTLPPGVASVEELWFRYLNYDKGDRVWYAGQFYEAKEKPQSGLAPVAAPDVWAVVGKDDDLEEDEVKAPPASEPEAEEGPVADDAGRQDETEAREKDESALPPETDTFPNKELVETSH